MTQAPNAWMNGELVGTWIVERNTHTFRYAPSWLESPHRSSLSLSLPISSALETKGAEVKNYFDNLLPDNEWISAPYAGIYQCITCGHEIGIAQGHTLPTQTHLQHDPLKAAHMLAATCICTAQ